MTKEQLGVDIEDVMVEMFDKVHSPSLVAELSKPDVTEHERGRIAGQIELAFWLASKLNPVKEEEEVQDEDGLSGQKLED